jgi:hypothetical protein
MLIPIRWDFQSLHSQMLIISCIINFESLLSNTIQHSKWSIENANCQGQFGTSLVTPALLVSEGFCRVSFSSRPNGLFFASRPSKVYIGSDRAAMTVPTEEELLVQQIEQQKIKFSVFWCVKASNIG